MPNTSHSLLNYLRVVVGAWRDDPRDDAALLTRFAQGGDEAAFRVLVCRHGPLVWQTCRRILGDTPDAEDAFQTTFLALARKAGQFPVTSLVGWLHRVARRAALNADASAQRRRSLEQRLWATRQSATAEDASRAELYEVLDEELAGLPDRLRVPLVLRYLEGKTLAEVAQIWGCSLTAVTKRLARGEAVLRERLERRGMSVGVASLSALLASTVTTSAVPARLIGSAARAAAAFRSGTLTGGVAEAARTVLGALPSSLGTTIMRKSLGIVLACCLGLGGTTLVAYRSLSAWPNEPGESDSAITQPPNQPRPEAGVTARVDYFGDPLPAHALARMGTTRLWQPPDGQGSLAFSSDGKTLASSMDHKTICLWDVATGKEIHQLTTKAVKRNGRIWLPSIVSLGFSRDGKTLITVNWDQTVCRWEVVTGKFLRKQQYQGPESDNGMFPIVAFLSNGQMLGFRDFQKSSQERKEVRGAYVWDVATGKEICQLSESRKRMKESIWVCAFSPDGKLLATVLNDEKKAEISLWDVATGREIHHLGDKGYITEVVLSPDRKTLATADDDQICVWEIATGKKIRRLEGSGGSPLIYSPDGRTLVGGSEGRLWDVRTGKKIRSFGWNGAARVACFSPDGKALAVGDRAGSIRLWEVATGKELGPRKGYRGPIRSVAYSPDSKTLASGGWGGSVHLWETATGKEIHQLAKHAGWDSGSVAYSPDSKMLVSIDCHEVHLWDTATGKEIRHFGTDETERSWSPQSPAFSPDGKILALIMRSPSGSQRVCLWEVATGKQMYERPITGSNIHSYVGGLAFSPDGRMLAAPGKEDMVSLWEVATGKLIGQLGRPKKPAQKGKEFFIWSLAYSPDGRMLATSSSSDDKVHLWRVATDEEIWQLDGLENYRDGYTLAFSPDSRMLATAAKGAVPGKESIDPTVHLWEVASGKEIGRLAGHQLPIQTVAFSPDSKTLTSGSNDLTCLVWDVTLGGRLKPVPVPPLVPRALSKERLETAWTNLTNTDPAKAYRALWNLTQSPAQALALLRERIRPIAPVADPKQLQRWIADLDDNNFTVRDKARQEIEKLGEPAIPALRQALKGQPALEVKRRLQALLGELEPKGAGSSPQRMRELRAVQVLEYIGTIEARQLLQAWGKGIAEARLTQEAQAALARLAMRPATKL